MKIFCICHIDNRTWANELLDFLSPYSTNTCMLDDYGEPEWWAGVIENIENAHCILAVLSSPMKQSPYVMAQLAYAVARGLPVLPIIIEAGDMPDVLANNPIDPISGDADFATVGTQIHRRLAGITIDLVVNNQTFREAPKPAQPTVDASNLPELLTMAEMANDVGNFVLLEQILELLYQLDPNDAGKDAHERIVTIHRQRDDSYRVLLHQQKNLRSPHEFHVAITTHIMRFGADYDPENLFVEVEDEPLTGADDSDPKPERKIDRFTPGSRKILKLSELEAIYRGHQTITALHVLVALWKDKSEIASQILKDHGITQEKLDDCLDRLLEADVTDLSIQLDESTKRLLELAVQEAIRMNVTNIGPLNLLLGAIKYWQSNDRETIRCLDIKPRQVQRIARKFAKDLPDVIPVGDDTIHPLLQ